MRRPALLISIAAMACDPGTGPRQELTPFGGTTSEPVNLIAISASGAAPSISWVSMPPGTIEGATGATIRNLRTGYSVAVEVASGGFDPVAVPAQAADTLEIATVLADGGTYYAKSVVPARLRPRVVRTNPARGRTDVAINSSVIVVFSEPIDPATRDTVHIRVLGGAGPLPGEVRPVAGSEVTVEWVPSAPLDYGSTYELVLSETITDLAGDRIDGALTVAFRTTPPPPPPPPPLVPQVIAFSRGGDIHVMHADGTGIVQVTGGEGDDLHPVWSPDGRRIAFTRYTPSFEWMTESAVHVVNADGTGLVRLSPEGVTTDRQASWSPDGTRLAFSSGSSVDDRGVYIMNADGANRVRLTDQHTWVLYPIWSPDGSRVLFTAWDDVMFRLRLWVKTLGGGIATQIPLANEGGAVYATGWNADGSRIVTSVMTCLDGVPVGDAIDCRLVAGPHLTAADPDGANSVRLSDELMLPELWFPPPEWSPDGSTVLFTQAACDIEFTVYPCPGPTEIRVLRVADATITTLAEGSDPDWRR